MAPPSPVVVRGSPVSFFWLLAVLSWVAGLVIAVIGLIGTANWNRTDIMFAALIALFCGLLFGSLP